MLLRAYVLSLCFGLAWQQQTDIQKKTSLFAVDIFKATVTDQPNENVVVSPYSVQTVLAMTYMGATGATALEMSQAMHLSEVSKPELAEFYAESTSKLGQTSSLKSANKVYLKGEIHASFKKVSDKYNAEIENIDFSRSQETADEINRWVAAKTEGKVDALINAETLDENTRMVLINALYFKGAWLHKFEKRFTDSWPFWTSQTEKVDKDMMVTGNFFLWGYIPHLSADAIELKYADSDVSMFILLPRERTGLAQLESQLQVVDFKNMTDQMERDYVHVLLPRFKVEFKTTLNAPLQRLGMVKMFSDSAEFDDLLEGDEPLKVSEVVHKAVFEINEDGAEAAAAINVEITLRSPPSFHANHPFLYFLRLDESILFMGRFVK